MQKHKFNIFPEMKPEDLERLHNDLKQNGYDVRQPIFIYQDAILDGWNRYLVCQQLGITPTTKEFIGTDKDALLFVLRTNHRRNLTSSQWAAIAVDAEDIHRVLSEEAGKRKAQAKGQPRGQKASHRQLIAQENENPEDNKTRSKLAWAFNTNRTYVDMAEKLKESYPEKFQAVKSGEKTLTQVIREVKKEALKTPVPPSGKYRIIYADPPWKYSNTMPDYFTEQADHYPLMTIEELCNLPIKDIAEDNAVLFLWTTSPILEDVFQVIKSWGFKYKASFIWDKIKHNMGHYNSVRHEFLLICTRGSCTPDEGKLFDSVQSIERTSKHSEKPEEFRNIVDTLYTYGDRIELFARSQYEGWAAWGVDNERISQHS